VEHVSPWRFDRSANELRGAAIWAEGLTKRFGTVRALDGVDLEGALLTANWYFHIFDDAAYIGRGREAVRDRLITDATTAGRRALMELAGASRPESTLRP
jgi:hypothetical protein